MYKTRPFGRVMEPWMDADDYFAEQPCRCDHCGEIIPEGDNAYYVKNNYYCRDCEEVAMEEIFEVEQDNYLVEVDF